MGEELNLSCHNDTERFNKIKSELSSLKDLISKTLDKVCVPIDQAGYFEKLLIDIDEKFNEIFDYIERLNVISKTLEIEIENLISLSGEEIKNISDFNHFKAFILEFKVKILVLARSVLKDFQIQTYKDYKGKSEELVDVLKSKEEMLSLKINHLNTLIDDQKNIKVHKIFEDDSTKFRLIARFYEFAFYSIVGVLILYFLGLTFYVNNFNFLFIEADFPEKIHGKLSPEFYIQKVSLLVLSTTLAAFLLKRSFMNRRLADDAYRTAKELDALPRYMEGMPEEMKEKIRFDLAYKYFGNSIHHETYTGGENLMHENIKANTDFIKAVKDLSPKAEAPKDDKSPKDAA